ncbi:hypothetical protein J1N35_044375 [Gossypium stocksii]|uniref:Uncharacterized protein n=1 Tax=Gossypium stocksii TaxID=47602 RepID=A0A9D3U8X6_9ROSI|nr:hypothetical protein J1N35_044375 [Gossypium stocksii]
MPRQNVQQGKVSSSTSLADVRDAEEPTQTPNARAESLNLGTTAIEWDTVVEEPEKTTSLNRENKEDEAKDETSTTTTATTKGKDFVLPTPSASTTVQDRDINHLIDELTKTDKDEDKMNHIKRKLWYKVSACKSTRMAK